MSKIKNKLTFVTAVLLVLVVSTAIVYAYSSGITGRTKKSASAGCSCHSPSLSTSTTVTIAGPDTVNPGQTVQFTLTVSNSSLAGAGVDIAVDRGSLSPSNSQLRSQDGELTHNSPISFVSGTASVPFSYTAPSTTGFDTIYATGNAVNLNSNSGGDLWNYASNKKIIIANTSSIREIGTNLPSNFELNQNYPNPFNPVTKIRFAVPVSSNVSLTVMDITGRIISELFKGNIKAGNYEYTFNGSNLSSGIYFYKLQTDNFTQIKKMTLVK
jgi:hypothetical protein